MGMAASQARYLALTSRKSTVEFQAQQINQQRTKIANELSGTFADLVSTSVPTVPSELNYQETLYKYSDTSRTQPANTSKYSFSKILSTDSQGYSTITLNLLNDAGGTVSTRNVKAILGYDSSTKKVNDIIVADSTINNTADLQALDIPDKGSSNIQQIAYTMQTNEEAYKEAMREYTIAKDKYDKRVQEINTKTVDLQKEDSTLELRLRQLDTEQNSIQTELESVKKVIEDTIETVFSTFKSS